MRVQPRTARDVPSVVTGCSERRHAAFAMRLSSSEARVLPDAPLNGVATAVDRSSDTRAAGQSGAHHRECVELGARHLAPVVDRLLLQERLDEGDDPTRMLRAQLKLHNVIGRSEAMAAVFREVAISARSAKTVLLTGQSGTGKTQIARVIHGNSPRAKHRFVDITCGNIRDSLFLNQLFGYRRGAFTGAERDSPSALVGEQRLEFACARERRPHCAPRCRR